MKVDFKKTLDSYRAEHGAFRILDVPASSYLMVDGSGDPNSSPEYAAAIEALYPVAYTIKFASKLDLGRDYVVPPLEARWHWTVMLLAPDWITAEMFATAVEKVRAKREPSSLDKVRREVLVEERCVQTLHVGPYDEEAEVLARLHDEFIPGAGLQMTGKHHEIYLNDARRTDPARLRTILRQPVGPPQTAVAEPR